MKKPLADIVEDAVVHAETPPVLLRRESSVKKDQTAEFGTSALSFDNSDVELELGLECTGNFSSNSNTSCAQLQDDAPSFQASNESTSEVLVSTVMGI